MIRRIKKKIDKFVDRLVYYWIPEYRVWRCNKFGHPSWQLIPI